MLRTTFYAALIAVPQLALADGHGAMEGEVSAEVEERIMTMLADMQCEVEPENIEVEEDGYELDDVFCADGQYDIELDAELNETGRRKE
ncbi:PepSY domain-containing protein [Roseivivax sp. CAU 1761]